MSSLNPNAAHFQPSPLLNALPSSGGTSTSAKGSNTSDNWRLTPAAIAAGASDSFSTSSKGIFGGQSGGKPRYDPHTKRDNGRNEGRRRRTSTQESLEALPDAAQDTTIVRSPKEDGRVVIRSLEDEGAEPQPKASEYDTKREHGGAHGFQKDRQILLQAMEEKFGTIDACHFSHEGWAIVSFESPHSAEMAQRFSGEQVGGEKLRIEPINAEDIETPTSNSVVLKNLPFELEEAELEEQLDELSAKPESFEMFTDSKGKFRGVAFVRYKSAEDAREALRQFNGKELRGRHVQGEYRKTPLLSARKPEEGPLYQQQKGGENNRRNRARSRGSSFGSPLTKPSKNPFGSLNSPKDNGGRRSRGDSGGEMREFALDEPAKKGNGVGQSQNRQRQAAFAIPASPLSNSPPVSFSQAIPSYAYGESQLRQEYNRYAASRVPRSPLYLPSSPAAPPMEPLTERHESESAQGGVSHYSMSMREAEASGRSAIVQGDSSSSQGQSVILRAASSSSSTSGNTTNRIPQFKYPARHAKGPSEDGDPGFHRSREKTRRGNSAAALRRQLEEKRKSHQQASPGGTTTTSS
eukprot:gb/GECG01010994.1/.p1 GENE.gb/GECG01010994.1/~~gb/GECG01010994.1/.p1  ORF type:complete len:579 (+),score=105.33 gb/GECG01010994.1/:1-1737(+)